MMDVSTVSVMVWRAKLAGLRAWEYDEDHPKVRQAIAALTYWRMSRIVGREVSDGHLSAQLADAFLERLRFVEDVPDDAGEKTTEPAEDGSVAAGADSPVPTPAEAEEAAAR